MTVVPSISRNCFWIVSSSSRWCTVTPGAKRIGAPLLCCSYFSGSSVTTTIFFAPSASSSRVISGTRKVPSTGWPPVIATASLKRIL